MEDISKSNTFRELSVLASEPPVPNAIVQHGLHHHNFPSAKLSARIEFAAHTIHPMLVVSKHWNVQIFAAAQSGFSASAEVVRVFVSQNARCAVFIDSRISQAETAPAIKPAPCATTRLCLVAVDGRVARHHWQVDDSGFSGLRSHFSCFGFFFSRFGLSLLPIASSLLVPQIGQKFGRSVSAIFPP